jgi:hypothetical protein
MRGPVVYALNNVDNAFLRENADVTVDVSSISEPVPDPSFRPGGLKCTAIAKKANGGTGRKLTFTEFIDPAGMKTFFLPSGDENRIKDDEFATRQY